MTSYLTMGRSAVGYGCLEIASLLTDPVCGAHRKMREIQFAEELFPGKEKWEYSLMKLSLSAQTAFFSALGLFTGLPGVCMRKMGSALLPEPFVHTQHVPEVPRLDRKRFSLFFGNVAALTSGHVYTNAGVAPFSERVEKIAQVVDEKKVDVACFCELMDFSGCKSLEKELAKRGFREFYYTIGANAFVSSGLFVASKYKLASPEFTSFSDYSGRACFSNKGVFSFDVVGADESRVARVHVTHPQHSEESSYPTMQELAVRQGQFDCIETIVEKSGKGCQIVVGDFNRENQELKNAKWKLNWDQGGCSEEPTWDGDDKCAEWTLQRASSPQRLDVAMVRKGTGEIKTEIIPVGYDPRKYLSTALSDHKWLKVDVRAWQSFMQKLYTRTWG